MPSKNERNNYSLEASAETKKDFVRFSEDNKIICFRDFLNFILNQAQYFHLEFNSDKISNSKIQNF